MGKQNIKIQENMSDMKRRKYSLNESLIKSGAGKIKIDVFLKILQ
jgi:hypothetical protein